MTQHNPRVRIGTCLFLTVLLLVVVLLSVIVIPKYILTQAQSTYGASSSELHAAQRLYLATLILLQSKELTQPVNPEGADTMFSIQMGESVPSIVGRLWDSGLITNPGVFRSYLQYSGLDMSLRAGDHLLSPAMSPIEIAQAIQSSVSPNVTLTILPGWRIEEIA